MLKKISTRTNRLALVVAAFAAFAAAPAGASAAGLVPAGDNFTLTSQTVAFNFNNGPMGSCTMNGGGGTVPKSGSSVALTTRPTFSSCSIGGVQIPVYTYGSWSLEFPGGAAADMKIPAGGLVVGYLPCEKPNASQIVIKGSWKNGTFPPATTKSSMTTTPFSFPISGCGQVNFGGASFTVSNTTRPELPIYLNP